MEDREWLNTGMHAPQWIESEMEALGRPTILLVEDDRDIRELLVTLFELAGFLPHACASAEEGLEQLREQAFDSVLTDYMLPSRSGAWLLHQAMAEGLLDATPAMVITAHPNPGDAEGFEIIRKPFDLDDLVDHVRRRVEGTTPGPRRRPVRQTPPPRSDGAGRDDDGNGGGHEKSEDCPDPIELILYVSSHSPHSASAVENVRRVVDKFKSSRVRLTIHDLSKDPSRGEPDAVAFTPTLVKRSPGPRTFILGHITNPGLLLELLEACESERRN